MGLSGKERGRWGTLSLGVSYIFRLYFGVEYYPSMDVSYCTVVTALYSIVSTLPYCMYYVL